MSDVFTTMSNVLARNTQLFIDKGSQGGVFHSTMFLAKTPGIMIVHYAYKERLHFLYPMVSVSLKSVRNYQKYELNSDFCFFYLNMVVSVTNQHF